jgi:hypothetical protein
LNSFGFSWFVSVKQSTCELAVSNETLDHVRGLDWSRSAETDRRPYPGSDTDEALFLVDVAGEHPDEASGASTERERERLHTSIEELDHQRAIGDRSRLSD